MKVDNINNQRLKKILISAAAIIFMFTLSLSNMHFVHAVCSAKGDAQCVSQNCSDAQKAAKNPSSDFIAKCQNAINACDATNSVGNPITGGMAIIGADQGDCSNALRSCFQNEINQDACLDSDVLAIATQCADGNVNADGNDVGGNCGMDNAIRLHNKYDGGTDFSNNAGIKEDRTNNATKQCDNGQNYPDTKSRTDCQNNARDQVNACYSENGGTASSTLDNTKFNNCMASKATTKAQCAAVSGGQWDDTTKKCTVPPPPPVSTGCTNNAPVGANGLCPDGSNPNEAQGANGPSISGGTGRCGEARVNILVCGNGSESGATVFQNILRIAILVLSILVGIAAVGGLAWASVTYARAADNAGTVSQAKDMIRNIVIGLLLYGFLIAIVNWLVPGAVFG